MSTDLHTLTRLQDLERQLARSRREIDDARTERDDAHRHHDRLLASAAELERERNAANKMVDAFREASGLLGGGGDPGDVTPAALERYVSSMALALERLAARVGFRWPEGATDAAPVADAVIAALDAAQVPVNLHGPGRASPPIAPGHYWETRPDGTRTLRALRLVGQDEGPPEGSG